jgi:hypothetical protein
MSERLLSASICLLLLTSMAPTVAAVGPSDSVIWGVSYDWSHFEGDIENMTGVDTNAVNEDLEDAAEYAGFILETDQVVSGGSHFFVESWDDDDQVTVEDINGISHQVTKRVTELTIRHGMLFDMGFTAAWTDENESIDIWMSASQETVMVIDATYIEYVDSNLMVYGGDLEMSGELGNQVDLSFNLQVIAADEVEAPEIDLGYSVLFEIPTLSSEWRVDEPLDYLHHLTEYPVNEENGSEEGGVGDEYEGGRIRGDYSTVTGYSLYLSMNGLPTEDFGVNLDVFNVELSDSIPGTGDFLEEMPVMSGAFWDWECPPVSGTESLSIDDSTFEVQCGFTPPFSAGMAFMMGASLVPAFDNGFQQLASVIEEQVGAWMDEVSSSGNGTFVCDNGEEIPAEWENDGWEDCSDGSDENEQSAGATFTCDNGETIPASWEDDGEEDCSDGSDENDESTGAIERFERMAEALMNTNLNKTMEAFADKLELLVEDNVPSEPVLDIEDSCAIMFWTTDDSRVVGFAVLNDEDGDDFMEVLLGPEMVWVGNHGVEMNLQYFDGNDARDAKDDILGLTQLRDIAPESKHDVEELYDILGDDFLPDLDQTDTDGDGVIDFFDQDDDGDGLFDWEDPDPLAGPVDEIVEDEIDSIPGPSILAVITMLGAAAILMPRRED